MMQNYHTESLIFDIQCLIFDHHIQQLAIHESDILPFNCIYSLMTTSSSGFEAFFDADMVLVIAVCIKKERFCLKVTDCDIADGCWVCLDYNYI